MSEAELCYLSAGEALARFRARELSPVELMQAVIARAAEVEPRLNAFPFEFFEQALAQARRAERRYAGRRGRPRALEGLPVAIKDESYIAGQITTNGSLVLREERADSTSPAVERLLRAGAIVHARTATPEFSCAAVTHSRLWGVTRNPWNPAFTPGGSSGGAAAALAAGSTTLANGSDIAGSIRIPASACGVVGFKPTYGRNPDDAPFNLDFYNHAGPLARSVGDCALMQNVMCGPHPRDIATLRPKRRVSAVAGDLRGWRIAFSMDLGCFPVDAEVRRNTRAALEGFRELGAEVHEVDLGWTAEVSDAARHYLTHLFGAYIAGYLPAHRRELTTYARAFAEAGRRTTARDFLRSLEVAGEMYATLGPVLQRHRLLVCPTLALPAVAADHDPVSGEVIIEGVRVEPDLGWCMTYPFNMLSRCPVMSLPSGFAASGVPTGIQLVGRTFDDAGVFRAAAAFEQARPWAGRRPGVTASRG